MPAISCQLEFLDPLLLSEKEQTTRPQTKRFHGGDITHMYIRQRQPILSKPLRRLTYAGIDMMHERGYPLIPEFHQAIYHAHFLGKVVLTEVYDICFCDFSHAELKAWALDDGFKDTSSAEVWFLNQYGCDYPDDIYTVTRWHGWLERYFYAGEVIARN